MGKSKDFSEDLRRRELLSSSWTLEPFLINSRFPDYQFKQLYVSTSYSMCHHFAKGLEEDPNCDPHDWPVVRMLITEEPPRLCHEL